MVQGHPMTNMVSIESLGYIELPLSHREIDILFSTITNNNYFKNIVTQWKTTRGNTPSKLVA